MDAILDNILNICIEILKRLIMIYIVISFLRFTKEIILSTEIGIHNIELFITVQKIGNNLNILFIQVMFKEAVIHSHKEILIQP